MTTALQGPGFLLKKGDGGSPENFTTVAEVKDIKFPALALDTVDATNQSSPNNFEEVLPTIKRGGTVTFTCHFQPDQATHGTSTGLWADWQNRTNRNWQITAPGTSKVWAFSAYVTKLAATGPVVGVMTGDIELRVSAQPTLS